MQILLQLGANNTAYIQLLLFIISITVLTVFVFGPFFKAYDARSKQTRGAEQIAGETQDEAKKLESVYKARAREINEKITTKFELAKKEAASSSETVLSQAKKEAAVSLEKAQAEIGSKKNEAIKEVQTLAQELGREIVKKLSGAPQ